MEYVEIVASLLKLDRDQGSVNPLNQSSSSNGLPVKPAERVAVNLKNSESRTALAPPSVPSRAGRLNVKSTYLGGHVSGAGNS